MCLGTEEVCVTDYMITKLFFDLVPRRLCITVGQRSRPTDSGCLKAGRSQNRKGQTWGVFCNVCICDSSP